MLAERPAVVGSPCPQLLDGARMLTAAQSCEGWQQPRRPALPCAWSRALVAATAQGQSWGAPPSAMGVCCPPPITLPTARGAVPGAIGVPAVLPAPSCSPGTHGSLLPASPALAQGCNQQQRGCRGETSPWHGAGRMLL